MMIFGVYEIGFRSGDAFRGHGSNYFFREGAKKMEKLHSVYYKKLRNF